MKQNAGNGISNRTNPPQAMIDTLSIASDLAAAGVAKPQAEAHARAIASAVGQQYGDLATKDFVRSEIGSLRAEMNAEISSVRRNMSAMEVRLVRWIVGAGFVYTGLLLAVIRFAFLS